VVPAAAHQPFSTDFRRFLASRLLGNAALQMLLVALGWQVYALTDSAWDLGLVGLLQFVPSLVLAIPAGQLVDRVDRRRVMVAATAIQASVAIVLAWASVGGWLHRDLILALAAGIGAARALNMPAQQAMVPTLVPLVQLPRATAVSSMVMKVAVVGGPALGGFIYAAGPEVVYAIAAGLLAACAACVASISPDRRPPAREPVSWASVFAGFSFLWRHKVALGAISLDLFAVLLGGATALLPIFARDVLDTGPWGLGLLRSAPAIGAIVVGAWVARRPPHARVGRTMFIAVAVYGLAMFVFGLSHSFWLSLVALAVSGGADMVSVVIRMTLVQVETPDEMRGRVSAVNSVFIGASNELGEFRAGATAEYLGAVGSVLAGAAGDAARGGALGAAVSGPGAQGPAHFLGQVRGSEKVQAVDKARALRL
jgi:MFS family permease